MLRLSEGELGRRRGEVDVEAVGLTVVVSVSSVFGEEVSLHPGRLCVPYVGTEGLFFGHWGPLKRLME